MDRVVSFWRFDNASGTPDPPPAPAIAAPTAFYSFDTDGTDSSGNGLNLTLTGSPTFTAGKISNAMNLTGTNYATVADTALLRAGASFSVAGWANPNAAVNNYVFAAKRDSNSTIEFQIMSNTGGVSQNINLFVSYLGSNGSNNYTSGDTITFVSSSPSWQFWVFIYDGTKPAANRGGCAAGGSYPAFSSGTVNGTPGNPYNGTSHFCVGEINAGAIKSIGSYDSLAYWHNYALTSAEVTALYNAGAGKVWNGSTWV